MTSASSKMKGVCRVAFLAHQDTIRAELAQGWPVKAIYLRYAEQLAMSYQQFARYVRRYLKADQTAKTVQATKAEHVPPPTSQDAAAKSEPKSST